MNSNNCGSTSSQGNAINGDRNTPTPTDITHLFDGSGADVASVYFGAKAASDVRVINDHLLRVVVPAGATLGKVDVVVNGVAGELTRKTLGYEYVDGSSAGAGGTIKCDKVPGAPSTGMAAVPELVNSQTTRNVTLIIMLVSFGLAGALLGSLLTR